MFFLKKLSEGRDSSHESSIDNGSKHYSFRKKKKIIWTCKLRVCLFFYGGSRLQGYIWGRAQPAACHYWSSEFRERDKTFFQAKTTILDVQWSHMHAYQVFDLSHFILQPCIPGRVYLKEVSRSASFWAWMLLIPKPPCCLGRQTLLLSPFQVI